MPAFIFNEVIIQQYQDIVRMQEIPHIVDDADPVRIAVGRNAQITFSVQHIILQCPQRLRRRRGQFSAKQGIMSLMDRLDRKSVV